MANGFKKVRKYFDMLDINGDRLIDMGEFTSQVSAGQIAYTNVYIIIYSQMYMI